MIVKHDEEIYRRRHPCRCVVEGQNLPRLSDNINYQIE